jgi:hypothetical protein
MSVDFNPCVIIPNEPNCDDIARINRQNKKRNKENQTRIQTRVVKTTITLCSLAIVGIGISYFVKSRPFKVTLKLSHAAWALVALFAVTVLSAVRKSRDASIAPTSGRSPVPTPTPPQTSSRTPASGGMEVPLSLSSYVLDELPKHVEVDALERHTRLRMMNTLVDLINNDVYLSQFRTDEELFIVSYGNHTKRNSLKNLLLTESDLSRIDLSEYSIYDIADVVHEVAQSLEIFENLELKSKLLAVARQLTDDKQTNSELVFGLVQELDEDVRYYLGFYCKLFNLLDRNRLFHYHPEDSIFQLTNTFYVFEGKQHSRNDWIQARKVATVMIENYGEVFPEDALETECPDMVSMDQQPSTSQQSLEGLD